MLVITLDDHFDTGGGLRQGLESDQRARRGEGRSQTSVLHDRWAATGEVCGRAIAEPAGCRFCVDALRYRELRTRAPYVVAERPRRSGDLAWVDDFPAVGS